MHERIRLPGTAIGILSALAASAQPPARPPAGRPATLKLPIEQYALPNGLTVILSVDRTTPTVAVNVWYKVGSKHEVGRTGFAHLFEHVMFTGSGNVPYGLHDKLPLTCQGDDRT